MDETASRLTPLQWVIAIIAAIGFAFDSYVLLVLPLIARPALIELLHVPPTSPAINDWVGIIFYVPAVAGGIFGLLGGYLTDLLGRRRVLVWSILLYAFSALASGYSTSVLWLLFWRCGTFVGVCVEFVAAVAWVSELFPNPRQREAVVGYTQVVGSLGGLMVTGAYYLVVTYGERLPLVRRPRSVALHADVRRHPCDSPHPGSAVPAGIPGVAREEAGRHAQAPQLR
jgi:MFS family permease